MSKFFDSTIWIKAANQVVFSISLGVGGNILFSKYRRREEKVLTSSVLIPMLTFLFGLFCAFINFCFLGNLSFQMNTKIENLPISGSDLAFVTYPSALNLLPFANFWSIIFFFMLVTLGIDTQFTFNEQVSYYVFKYFLKKRNFQKTTSTMIVCISGVIFNLIFITNAGFYFFVLFDDYVTLISCFVICLFECYVAAYHIGIDKFQKLSVQYTNCTVPEYFFLCYKYICPLIFGFFTIRSIINMIVDNDNKYYHVFWAKIISWVIVCLPLFFIVYYFILHYKEEDKFEEEKELNYIENFENRDTLH